MDWKGFFGQRIVKIITAGAVLGSVYMVQPYRPVVFVGQSMTPTYKNGEWAMATTNLGPLRIGDVVVMEGPEGTIIKRVAYLPGDWVPYHKVADEWQYGNRQTTVKLKHPERFPAKQIRVPEGYIFVLGDNYNVSTDSRTLGVLPIGSIKAKLVEPRVPKKLGEQTALSR